MRTRTRRHEYEASRSELTTKGVPLCAQSFREVSLLLHRAGTLAQALLKSNFLKWSDAIGAAPKRCTAGPNDGVGERAEVEKCHRKHANKCLILGRLEHMHGSFHQETLVAEGTSVANKTDRG